MNSTYVDGRDSNFDCELAITWVEALRSGEYVQDAHQLRSSRGYCVMGVLCDVANPNAWVNSLNGLNFQTYSYAWKPDGCPPCFAAPPPELVDRVGLDALDYSYLVDANDRGRPFDELADFIEERLSLSIDEHCSVG